MTRWVPSTPFRELGSFKIFVLSYSNPLSKPDLWLYLTQPPASFFFCHIGRPCALWIGFDDLHLSHLHSHLQTNFFIKFSPICVIDLFPSRNEPHVTCIVFRLKRSWSTSAVNHKLPLTRGITSPCVFVLGQTIVSVPFWGCCHFFHVLQS